jgi:hypothetical protein
MAGMGLDQPVLPQLRRREESALQLERDAVTDGVGEKEVRLVLAELPAKILIESEPELRRLVLHLVKGCVFVKGIDEKLALLHVFPEHRGGNAGSAVGKIGGWEPLSFGGGWKADRRARERNESLASI